MDLFPRGDTRLVGLESPLLSFALVYSSTDRRPSTPEFAPTLPLSRRGAVVRNRELLARITMNVEIMIRPKTARALTSLDDLAARKVLLLLAKYVGRD